MIFGLDCFSFISYLNVYVNNILYIYIIILKLFWYVNYWYMCIYLIIIIFDLEIINDGL